MDRLNLGISPQSIFLTLGYNLNKSVQTKTAWPHNPVQAWGKHLLSFSSHIAVTMIRSLRLCSLLSDLTFPLSPAMTEVGCLFALFNPEGAVVWEWLS